MASVLAAGWRYSLARHAHAHTARQMQMQMQMVRPRTRTRTRARAMARDFHCTRATRTRTGTGTGKDATRAGGPGASVGGKGMGMGKDGGNGTNAALLSVLKGTSPFLVGAGVIALMPETFKQTRTGLWIGVNYPYTQIYAEENPGAVTSWQLVCGVLGFVSASKIANNFALKPGSIFSSAMAAFRVPFFVMCGLFSAKLTWNVSPLMLEGCHRVAKTTAYAVDGFFADIFGYHAGSWESDGLTVEVIEDVLKRDAEHQAQRAQDKIEEEEQKAWEKGDTPKTKSDATIINKPRSKIKREAQSSRRLTESSVLFRDFLTVRGTIEAGEAAVLATRNDIKKHREEMSKNETGQEKDANLTKLKILHQKLQRRERRHQVLLMKRLVELRGEEIAFARQIEDGKRKGVLDKRLLAEFQEQMDEVEAEKKAVKEAARAIYGSSCSLSHLVNAELAEAALLLWAMRNKQRKLALEYINSSDRKRRAWLMRKLKNLDKEKKKMKSSACQLHEYKLGKRASSVKSWRKIVRETV